MYSQGSKGLRRSARLACSTAIASSPFQARTIELLPSAMADELESANDRSNFFHPVTMSVLMLAALVIVACYCLMATWMASAFSPSVVLAVADGSTGSCPSRAPRQRSRQGPWHTSRELSERLQAQYPGVCPEGRLRTLQRRLKDWRREAAHRMVLGTMTSILAMRLGTMRAGCSAILRTIISAIPKAARRALWIWRCAWTMQGRRPQLHSAIVSKD